MRSAPSLRAQSPSLILLVDDNQDGVVARRSILEELGYRVVSAADGPSALKKFDEQDFDLIITDFKMGSMNGIELIAHLRQRKYTKPIILLTGFADSIGLREQNTGADIVIQKSANEIATLVRHTKRLLSPRKPVGSIRKKAKAQTR